MVTEYNKSSSLALEAVDSEGGALGGICGSNHSQSAFKRGSSVTQSPNFAASDLSTVSSYVLYCATDRFQTFQTLPVA